MENIYKKIWKVQPKKHKTLFLIWFLICLYTNKKLNSIVTELFIRRRKLNISIVFYWLNIPLVFILQSYFKVPKDVKLNTMHFLMKISNKRELQQIAYNHSSAIDFLNFYKKCTATPYSFLVHNATLASDNPLCFRKNLLGRI